MLLPRHLALVLCLCALPALAETGLPSGLQPLPEPPPPPAGYEPDPSLEPQVTISQRGEDKVEEYRINGRHYMTKVTPPHGVPYYLVDHSGAGEFTRYDVLGAQVSAPMWVLGTF